MALMFNTCLSVDLIYMVRNPFAKKESRMAIYWGVSLFVSLFITIGAVTIPNDEVISIAVYFNAVILVVYGGTLIFSIIFTCKKLSGPGMSKEVRGLLLKRYILAAFLYCIANIYLFAAVAMQLKYWEDDIWEKNGWGWNILKLIFSLQGFYIPLSRFSEPYFYQIVKANFFSFVNKIWSPYYHNMI